MIAGRTELSNVLARQDVLTAIFKTAPHPIIVKNSASQFLFLNDAACDLIGARSEDVVGRTDYDFLPRAEADAIRAMDIQIFDTGEEKLFEEVITGRDGSPRTLKTHKRRVGLAFEDTVQEFLIVEFQDVTELRKAERVLRASEEHHRSLIELHPQTPWLANAAGEIIEVGAEWEHLSGRSRDEAAGSGWESSVHQEDLLSVKENWARSVETGAPLDIEFRVANVDGEVRWFRSRAAPKRSPTGKITRWYGLLEDVHERRLALDALRKSEQSLIEHRDELEKLVKARTAEVSRKNAELDRLLQQEREVNALQRRFVAMISHEFRTPLAIIDSAAQRLTRTKTAVTSDYLSEKSAQIKGAVARMVELMESILAAGRLRTGTIAIDRQPCSLAAVIDEAVKRRRDISATHDIHFDVTSLPQSMPFDRDAVDRVISNLLSNAVKYSPHSSDIYIRGWQEEGWAKVSVRDTGIGMDVDDLPRLFEPYFRARSATGIAGTGIGLNIVREIIELHGGTISVTSEIGKGTTFTISLPVDHHPRLEQDAA
ncbi:sensor histidine kinase [Neorhizobium alkalisoli]|uniref:sensor histidine kinase n=1 Tax=Neorhizobium alkalisoli TaxID=528178 RepID=UPI000CF9B3D2|nr:ATP-binding protein [Neorhizobium alkalisoli]